MTLVEKEIIYNQKYDEYMKACDEKQSFIRLNTLLIELVNAKLDLEEEKRKILVKK